MAKLFRIVFRLSFFKKRFFGIQKRIFAPLNLFKGITETIVFKNEIILELHIDDWIQENIYFTGEYEEAELQFIQSYLKSGDTFIDIGANIGVHTLFASKIVGENGRVISFEPFEKNYQTLKNNITLNGSANIVYENLAIYKTDSTLEIYYDSKEANLGMASSHITEFSSVEKIKAVSIDSYLGLNPQQKIDFIKIDIEGGEYDALLGLKNTLLSFYPKLLVEILDYNKLKDMSNKRNIITFLENLGYTKYFINDNGKPSLTEGNNERMNFVFIKESLNNIK